MNNKYRIFDNIGFYCSSTNSFFTFESNILGFNSLDSSHLNYHIPYIVKNLKEKQIEIGLGKVVILNNNIVIERTQIISSSNNNSLVEFSGKNNEFYLFANQSFFDKNTHNVVVVSESLVLDAVSSVYLVDASNCNIEIQLPSTNCDNLIIEFKRIDNNHNTNVFIKENESVFAVLTSYQYCKLAYNNNWFKILHNNKSPIIQTQDVSTQSISIMEDTPTGPTPSYIPYSIGDNSFGSTNIFWNTANTGLLLGSDSINSAKHYIPTTGNQHTLFNLSTDSSNFVIYGKHHNRNIFFHNDGRLGINIPINTNTTTSPDHKPSTVLHLHNRACLDAVLIENKAPCTSSNINLYHNPSGNVVDDTTIGSIKMSATNNSNITTYANISSKVLSTSSKLGSLILSVASGNEQLHTIVTDPNKTTIGYPNAELSVNRSNSNIGASGLSIRLSANNSSIALQQNQVTLSGSSISLHDITSSATLDNNTFSLNNAVLSTSGIILSSINSGLLLTVDEDSRITSFSGLTITDNNISIPSVKNKILSTNDEGQIVGINSFDDYFRTEKEITWNKYQYRNAGICLRQITFDPDTVPIAEFVVGDQIEIEILDNIISETDEETSTTSRYYPIISEITATEQFISSLLINESVDEPSEGVSRTARVRSITRGAYLSLQTQLEDSEIEPDTTTTIISNRPGQDTIFNLDHKDINFAVFGTEDEPAIMVNSNTTPALINKSSGVYFTFANQNNSGIFPATINVFGSGLSNAYLSANYNYDDSINIDFRLNQFSGIVSSVGSNGLPSYYGTYDQNGNAAEWVEDMPVGTSRASTRSVEMIAGGSWSTTIDDNLKDGVLNSYEYKARASGWNDVGFRIASSTTIADVLYIKNTLELDFVVVSDIGNMPDLSSNAKLVQVSPTNTKTYTNLTLANKGKVDYEYRIGKFELTNQQYSKFLNSLHPDVVNDFNLYDIRMSTETMGGINKTGNNDYTPKLTMYTKPALFVSYISAIRFINWLHNNPTNFNSSDNPILQKALLNRGAYLITSTSTGFAVEKRNNPKYWLPSFNEWYKAAYYKPIDPRIVSSATTVSIKQDHPEIVAVGTDPDSNESVTVLANLSVKGWLSVDHIIVKDNTIRSPLSFTKLININKTDPDTISILSDKVTLRDLWNTDNSIDRQDGTSCINCEWEQRGLKLNTDNESLCDNEDNRPWFCDPDNTGPSWF